MFNFLGGDGSGPSSGERTPKMSCNDELNPGSVLEREMFLYELPCSQLCLCIWRSCPGLALDFRFC